MRLRATLAALALSVGLVVAAPAAPAAADGDDNAAVAINTRDGASVFRLAFAVRLTTRDVVDSQNVAFAYSSCTDCQTIALAFQVVLVWGEADVVSPENYAIAYNQDCTSCTTYAVATQIVLPVDGPAHLTPEGYRRLIDLYRTLRGISREEEPLELEEFDALIDEANAELLAIFTEELVVVDAGAPTTTTSPAESSTTTDGTTTSTEGTTTSTEGTTTTTAPPETSTTTTTTTTAP